MERSSSSLLLIILNFPPVAQLDNAADSDSEERGFDSLRAGQKKRTSLLDWFFFIDLINYRGVEQAVKKQSGGLFFRRGNEHKRGDRCG